MKPPYLLPWIRALLLIRSITSTTWGHQTWPEVKPVLRRALEMRRQIGPGWVVGLTRRKPLVVLVILVVVTSSVRDAGWWAALFLAAARAVIVWEVSSSARPRKFVRSGWQGLAGAEIVGLGPYVAYAWV